MQGPWRLGRAPAKGPARAEMAPGAVDAEVEAAARRLWSESRDLTTPWSEVDLLDSPPSPLLFLREYVSQNKPCVIPGAARHWPATSLWPHDSYLVNSMRGRAVSVHVTPDGRADALAPHPSAPSLCFASAFVQKMPFEEALPLIASSPSQSAPFVSYAQEQNDCLRSEYSAIAGDVEGDLPWATEALGCSPEAVNLWIGSGRSETSFHKDHYENLYAVVTGEKHFLLLPPTEVHRLYVRNYPAARYTGFSPGTGGAMKLEMEVPERSVPWCSVDPYPSSPEESKRAAALFPLYFDGPEPIHCSLRAGDILYLPSMWFHHVRQTPDSSGRVIAVNYWYDMQFDIKYAYFNFLQSIRIQPLPSCDADALGNDDADPDGKSS